jgi:hypothetical protein
MQGCSAVVVLTVVVARLLLADVCSAVPALREVAAHLQGQFAIRYSAACLRLFCVIAGYLVRDNPR